jgi:hypothetical protein
MSGVPPKRVGPITTGDVPHPSVLVVARHDPGAAVECGTAELPDRAIRLLSLARAVPERVIVAREVIAQLMTAET